MCGFIVTQNKHMAVTMLQRQEFRGPDGMDFWSDNTLTLGHALLDISGQNQKQPYKTKKGHILVFNGEMYDTTQPNDTKFLANGYDMYGLSFLEFTNWHGSIAIYQPKEKKVILIRDQFGAKPLWYYKKGKAFAAATSLRSFINKTKNDGMDKQFIFNPLWAGNTSPYQHIHKVAPGQVIEHCLETGMTVQRNLWQNYQIRSWNFDKQEFRKRTVESIRKIANNKQKTAIFLSGGLDSTFALSCIKDMGLDLTAYICQYDKTKAVYNNHDGFRGEGVMAEQTCKEWGIPYKIIVLKQEDMAHLSRKWIANTHFPWVDRNRQAPRYLLAQAASRDGCKVVITGDSADELYTGYRHHSKRITDPNWDKETVDRCRKMGWFPSVAFSKTDKFNNGLFFDLLSTSEQNILATDQTCGMFGMESRPVFLGQNYVQYIYSFNGAVKFKQQAGWHPGTYKYLLREVFGDMLPKHVRERKTKVGWSSPWNNNYEPMTKQWAKEDLDYLTVL